LFKFRAKYYMRLLSRYVVFFCDDCKLLDPAIEMFQSVNRFHKIITSEDESDFIQKVKQLKPELLLVYLHDPAREYISLLKTLRDEPDFSYIPLLVYKQLPQPNDLVKAFQTVLNFEQ
jgi:PleD family two-component response regulator